MMSRIQEVESLHDTPPAAATLRTEESGSCGTLFRGGRYGEVRV